VSLAKAAWKVLWLLAWLEVTEGWRTWFHRPGVDGYTAQVVPTKAASQGAGVAPPLSS